MESFETETIYGNIVWHGKSAYYWIHGSKWRQATKAWHWNL